MKKTLIFILLLPAFSGCEKQDTVTADGYYQGSLVYKGQPFFSAISFNGNNYSEVASGGALIQKFPCITKGTYTIKHNTISFAPTVLPLISDCQCGMFPNVKFDCQLNGDYKLVQSGKSITFQRGVGNELQVYNLTLINP
jgi:hypothetical protein